MSSFAEDVRKIARRTSDDLGRLCRAVKIDLFSSVIMDTRVDTGRLRGNWQTSTGAPKFAEIDRLDKEGTAAIAEVVQNVTAFGVDYLTNNLPYAQVWEDEDGAVEKNILRVENNVKNRARSYA